MNKNKNDWNWRWLLKIKNNMNVTINFCNPDEKYTQMCNEGRVCLETTNDKCYAGFLFCIVVVFFIESRTESDVERCTSDVRNKSFLVDRRIWSGNCEAAFPSEYSPFVWTVSVDNFNIQSERKKSRDEILCSLFW